MDPMVGGAVAGEADRFLRAAPLSIVANNMLGRHYKILYVSFSHLNFY
jgi:hypothetical protein